MAEEIKQEEVKEEVPAKEPGEEAKVETPAGETKKEVAEEIREEVGPDSPAKEAFRLLIERYKEQNPVKYALKKEALEKKLNSIK